MAAKSKALGLSLLLLLLQSAVQVQAGLSCSGSNCLRGCCLSSYFGCCENVDAAIRGSSPASSGKVTCDGSVCSVCCQIGGYWDCCDSSPRTTTLRPIIVNQGGSSSSSVVYTGISIPAGIIAAIVIGCLLFIGSIIGCIVCCVRGCCCRQPAPVVYYQQGGAPTAVVSNSSAMTAGGAYPQPQQFPMTSADNPQAASPYPPQQTASPYPPQKGGQSNPAFSPQQPPAYTEKY